MANSGRSNHSWGNGETASSGEFGSKCVHCALKEQEKWLLDAEGRPAFGLVWIAPNGRTVAVRPFKYSKNRRPSVKPTQTWQRTYADVPVSGTPACPKTPEGWH